MDEKLVKSLTDLIDETLAEIDELKKSDRFSASEIKLDGPGEGIAGKDPNGSIGKKEDADKEDDEDEEEEKKKEMDKAEGKNREADPNAGKHQVVKEETGMPKGTSAEKAEDKEDDEDEEEKKKKEMDKAEGKNREADPNAGKHQLVKSEEELTSLMKSYIDQRVAPIENKLDGIMAMIKEIADTPVSQKSKSYKDVTPLKKSEESKETLNKSFVVSKLFELKKSGNKAVDTADIASVELGGPAELAKIIQKYDLK